MRACELWAVLGLSGLLHTAIATAAETAAAPVRFTGEVLPILKQHCVACHMSGQEQGGLALAPRLAYQHLVGVPSIESALLRVQPGEPNASYLMHKLDGTHQSVGGSGLQMPLGAEPLTPAQRELLRRWITEGAPRN
jgi:mono/diheme cytochrome c family protein